MYQQPEEVTQVKDPNLVPYTEMDWILKPGQHPDLGTPCGGLAISNIRYCEDRQKMERDHIRAVVSVCGDRLQIPVKVEHLWIVVGDQPQEEIHKFFQLTYNFIEQHIKTGNVLVHCQAGISRSSCIVIAYLIRKHKIQFQSAFSIVRSERPFVLPNKGFIRQLKKLSGEVKLEQKKIKQREEAGLLARILRCFSD